MRGACKGGRVACKSGRVAYKGSRGAFELNGAVRAVGGDARVWVIREISPK